MNQFFANLLWRTPRQSTPAGRWTSWARSLSAGRRRIYSRHRMAVMQLLRPAIPVFRSSHRWELKAWSLFPRINLAIGPILQQAHGRQFSSLLARSAQSFTRNLGPQIRNDFLAATIERVFKSRPSAKAREHGPSVAAMGKPTERLAGASSVSDNATASMPRPLNRVFLRLAGRDIQTADRYLIRKRSRAQGVVEERRRIERYGPMSSMIARQDAASGKDLVTRAEKELSERLTELNKGTAEMARLSPTAGAIAGFSIDQLTEQVMRRIDDHIVAQKERMGKMF